MKNKFLLPSFLGVMLLCLNTNTLFAADAPSPNKTAASNSSIYSDPDKAILITKSSPHVRLRLKANPTTGYSWFLKSYDSLLVLKSHHYQAPSKSVPGAGGVETWDFVASPEAFTAPQVLKIELVYARPWDLHDNPSRSEFTVLTK